MKTVVGDKLTGAYLQKLSRQNYFATASAVVLVTISFFWMLFQFGGSNNTGLFANVMYPVASLIGAFWAGLAAYRARNSPVRLAFTHQLAWLMISLGLLSDGLGGAYYAYLGAVGSAPFPSLADIGFTLYYPFMCAGLLLMPASLHFRTRMGLDALITVLCLLGISWFFVIGPSYVVQHTHVSTLELIASLSYPCWDIVLILALVVVILRRSDPLLHSSLLILGIGILSDVWGDSIYAYQNVSGSFHYGTPYIDPFWFICSLLIGLAGLYQYTMLVHRAYNEQLHPSLAVPIADYRKQQQESKFDRRFHFFSSAFIYVPLTCLLVLMVYSDIVQEKETTPMLDALSAIVVMLITVRYLLAIHENDVLLRERQQRHEDSELLRRLTARLTNILEFESLLDNIVTTVSGELGFDAALLLLHEDNVFPATHLMVRAGTSGCPTVQTWHLYGERLSDCALLSGKEIEIVADTDEYPFVPSLLLQAWLQEQQVTTLFFVPLMYQGTKQGSLGFLRSKGQPLNLHDAGIAKSFTEEVAIVIEHGRLYHQAREHEAFAQAMANMAARLNAVVGAPTEIHQMICSEGANALNADVVLLYQVDESDQLLPIAVYSGEQEDHSDHDSRSSFTDWPHLASNGKEAETLSSLQPVLVHFNHSSALEQETPYLVSPTHFSARTTNARVAKVSDKQGSGQLSLPLRSQLLSKFVETAIFAPLISEGDAIGLLIFGRAVPPGTTEKKSLSANDLHQVQDFSEQAAVAFTNARLYQQLHMAHQQLQKLDQLKDQFMITASHELRTPLTSVQGYIELLAQFDELLPPKQRQEFLQKARRSCDELVVLLSNVMDASRLEIEAGIRPALMESVSVQDTISSILDLIEPQVAQEQRKVYVDSPPGLMVKTDPARLRQVLLNISTNALKYSPAGTPITFSARSLDNIVPCVVISIADKGNGIALEDQEHLFERFVRLERDVNSPIRGSGLGLYISRRLIEALGGEVWIESTGIPGEGSTFHVQLPAP